MTDRFCLDTSFLINGWRKHYPIDVFPSIWETIDDHIGHDCIWSCDEVFKELARQADDLLAWAKGRKGIFRRPTKATIGAMHDVMAKHPNFAALGGSINRADPWVIAEAMAFRMVVVTYEAPSSKPAKATKPPKIPDACNSLGVKCVTPIELFKQLGIKL